MIHVVPIAVALIVAALGVAGPCDLRAQEPPDERPAHPMDALLAEADSANPRIAAARRAVDRARAQVPQAGALPDPMLGIGFMNIPVTDPGLSGEMMTMTQVQVSTRLPWPGKLGLREDAARLEGDAAEWEVHRVRDAVGADLKTAYYELYFVDRALEVVERNSALLADFAVLTNSMYAVGTGRQPDVLKAQVEHTRLTEQLVDLRQRRAAVTARLNALLGRASDDPAPELVLPEVVRAAALDRPDDGPSFTSAALSPGVAAAAGAVPDPPPDEARSSGADGGSLPSLAELQQLARTRNPEVRARLLRIDSEERMQSLAEVAKRPDFSLSAGYSFRSGLGDFFNVMVSAPLPVFAGRKQDQGVIEAQASVARHREELRATTDALDAEVASLVADLRRVRDQLTLLNHGILPQARTALSSATASYRVGRVDFLTLLDAQVTLFRQELDAHRLLTDFATTLAALERAVGTEVLP